ncbi:hypothetical protein ACWFNE_20375 [Cellulomonas sp. NPDC055163]
MSTNDTEPSPWTRPSFITAAIVVAIVVMLGAALAIRALSKDDANAAPPEPTASASAEPSPTADDGTAGTDASICGLDGVETTGTVTMAPAAEWAFQGTTAYPTSPEFGPAATTTEGIRHCFQQSPEGALFAAANALVQATDPTHSAAWAGYFVSSGPQRDSILSEAGQPSSDSDVRMNIAGFRMLAFDGDAATVDVAVRGSSDGTAIVGSFVYELVWEAGDWKLDASTQTPFKFAAIPDLAGYVAWGA